MCRTELALYWAEHAYLQLGDQRRLVQLQSKLGGGPFLFYYYPLHPPLSLLRCFLGWPWVGLRHPEPLAATFPFSKRLKRRWLAGGLSHTRGEPWG